MNRMLSTVLCALALVSFVGCSKQPESNSPPKKTDDHGHSHDDGHDHSHDDHAHDEGDAHDHGDGSHGPSIELGVSKLGDWTVKAARDQGELKPGGEAAIDVWLTEGVGKVVAVRFWIGTEDGAGSVKAKADIENSAEPNHWHTHAELPSPMPAGAKLWVEIEAEGGVKTVGSFDLKVS